jgi:hypothetical protein
MRFARTQSLIVLMAHSWLGEYVHNVADLPQLTLLSPENSIPALSAILLVLAWYLLPFKGVVNILLLIWTLLHLVGGAILSVLPLRFLPFVPAQTIFHYVMHLVYGLAQIPLLIFIVRQLQPSRGVGSHERRPSK